MTTGDTSYNAQRAATRAAEAEHVKMLQWYAEQLAYTNVEALRVQLPNISQHTLRNLYKRYQELQ